MSISEMLLPVGRKRERERERERERDQHIVTNLCANQMYHFSKCYHTNEHFMVKQ